MYIKITVSEPNSLILETDNINLINCISQENEFDMIISENAAEKFSIEKIENKIIIHKI